MHPGEATDLPEDPRAHTDLSLKQVRLQTLELTTEHLLDLASSSSELQNNAFDAASRICTSSHCTVRCQWGGVPEGKSIWGVDVKPLPSLNIPEGHVSGRLPCFIPSHSPNWGFPGWFGMMLWDVIGCHSFSVVFNGLPAYCYDAFLGAAHSSFLIAVGYILLTGVSIWGGIGAWALHLQVMPEPC